MAKVPKTSGQGVSRKAYQTAYALGAKGAGDVGSVKGLFPKPDDTPREYGKDKASKLNVSYGGTLRRSDPKEVEAELSAEGGAKSVKALEPKKWKW